MSKTVYEIYSSLTTWAEDHVTHFNEGQATEEVVSKIEDRSYSV